MPSPQEKPEHVQPLPAGTAKIVKKLPVRTRTQKAHSLGDTITKNNREKPNRMGLIRYTLLFLYKNLYILGITLVRRSRVLQRRLRLGVSIVKGTFYAVIHNLSLLWGRIYRDLSRRLQAPFQRIRDTYHQQQPYISEARAAGTLTLPAYLPVIEMVWRLVWKILATVFNHVLPVAAVLVLIGVVRETLDKPMALQLEYEGQPVGYVQSEVVFDEATQLVRERVLDQNSGGIAIGDVSFSIVEVDPRRLLDSAEIADIIISRSGSEVREAYGLYVSNRFLGAVTDKDTILDELDAIRRESLTGKRNERTEFTKSIRFKPALYPSTSLVEAADLIARVRQNETESESYTVQEGDTPTEIADKNGMRYSDLLRLNPDIEDSLYPGDVLQTAVARPFLSVKNIFTDTYEEDIPFETEEVENGTYAKGYREVLQEGVDGRRIVEAEITTLNGVEIERTILNPDDPDSIITHPVTERIEIGINTPTSSYSAGSGTVGGGSTAGPSAAAPSSSGFIWPTSGGYATSYAGHTGNAIDIAPGGAGHPIYAARSGVVTKVVNGYTGYGHYVMIDHGDGFVTLYAHNSANYVSVGDYVSQGTVIASMGRTGWATGNHLHFEVRYNGRYMNPRDYVGVRG